jgi:hypothetical protein
MQRCLANWSSLAHNRSLGESYSWLSSGYFYKTCLTADQVILVTALAFCDLLASLFYFVDSILVFAMQDKKSKPYFYCESYNFVSYCSASFDALWHVCIVLIVVVQVRSPSSRFGNKLFARVTGISIFGLSVVCGVLSSRNSQPNAVCGVQESFEIIFVALFSTTTIIGLTACSYIIRKLGLPIFDLGAAKLTRGVCFLVKLVLVYDIIWLGLVLSYFIPISENKLYVTTNVAANAMFYGIGITNFVVWYPFVFSLPSPGPHSNEVALVTESRVSSLGLPPTPTSSYISPDSSKGSSSTSGSLRISSGSWGEIPLSVAQ